MRDFTMAKSVAQRIFAAHNRHDMKILILGSGGREHAFARAIQQSALCDELYIAPGNAGTELEGTNVDISVVDFESIAGFCSDYEIDMLVVGPEVPLVEGIADYFMENDAVSHVKVVGPTQQGAMLEGSKSFAKAFMQKYGVPTAAYREFGKDELEEAVGYVDGLPLPVVLKADGLAAGKGVVICSSRTEAKAELEAMFSGKFGEAGDKVVIEEFLEGIEFSAFILTDGETYVMLPQAKDYKRIGEGDTGLNTGGMGAISPVPFVNASVMDKLVKEVIEPTMNGIRQEGIDYKGFLFIGLMRVGEQLYVIEYNCRMGDPETEAIFPRLDTDLVRLMNSLFDGTLGQQEVEMDPRFATTVILVSGGYPEKYEKGKTIRNLGKATGSIIFHAGTKESMGDVLTAGGRVLAITSLADTMQEGLRQSMRNAEIIDFEGKYYRTDIGFDL